MPSGVYIRTEAYRADVSARLKGRRLPKTHRQSIAAGLASAYRRGVRSAANQSAALRGKPKSKAHTESVRRALTGRKLSRSHCDALAKAHRGKKQSKEHAMAAAKARTGLKRSPDFCAAVSARMKSNPPGKGKFGPANPNWIADRTKLARINPDKIRTVAHLAWARAVKRRDGGCVLRGCGHGQCAGRLESHHIKPFRDWPELRYEVSNGATLCMKHHPRKHSAVVSMMPLLAEKIKPKANLW